MAALIARAGRLSLYEGLQDRAHELIDSFRSELKFRMGKSRDDDIAELRELRRELEPLATAYLVRVRHDRGVLVRARKVRADILRDIVDPDVPKPKPNPFPDRKGRP